MVRVSDLRMREVINIADGRRLGPIRDIDVNLEAGRINAIVLLGYGSGGGAGRLMGFLGREEELIIPWVKIKRIGVDVILVDLSFDVHTESLHGGCV